MLALSGRGPQSRFRLVAAQRLLRFNAGCVTTTRFAGSFSKFRNPKPAIRRAQPKARDNAPRPTSTTSVATSQNESTLEKRTAAVYRVLRGGEPRQILLTLSDYANHEVVTLLPDSVFVSALLRITPEYFIQSFFDILVPVHSGQLVRKRVQIPAGVLRQLFQPLTQIIDARGMDRLGFVEYRHLLRLAASVGSARSTLDFWKSMRRLRIEPDVHCYNSVMQALVWEDAVFGPMRHYLRVTKWYYARRRFGEILTGYGTGKRSVAKQVRAILEEMEQRGVAPDEESHINRLFGSARVGGVDYMDSILKETWMIDVEAVMNQPPDRVPAAKRLARSSPLYPTRKLLFAVAHAYGCNSQFEEALVLTSHISQQYEIEITEDIWSELFERAYVLSRHRYGEHEEDFLLGKISLKTLFELKNMFRFDGQAYDMRQYLFLIKSVRNKDTFNKLAREAYQILQKTRKERNQAFRVLENTLQIPLNVDSASGRMKGIDWREIWKAPHVWRAFQKYEKLRLLVEQQHCIMEIIAQRALISYPFDRQRASQSYPRTIAEWKDFLPESYAIEMANIGKLEFCGRTHFLDTSFRPHYNDPVRRSDCGEFVADEDEQIQLSHRALWQRIKVRLGILAKNQPLKWFLGEVLRPYPAATHFKKLLIKDDPGENPSLDTTSDEEDNSASNPDINDVQGMEVSNNPFQKELEAGHEVSPHAFYVTMIPQFALPL